MSRLSYVIKLTGYIFDISDSENYNQLNNLSRYIRELYGRGFRFIIVVGGGAVLRSWIEYLRKFSSVSEYELDELGILFTRINAGIFRRLLHPTSLDIIPETIEEAIVSAKTSDKNIVLGGVSPGYSTNSVAAHIAARLSIPLINMTRAGGVFTKDPQIYSDAKKIDRISVNKLIELLSQHTESAGHYPLLDKTSLNIIKQYRVKTYIIPATKHALERLIDGECIGTEVDPNQ
jgi:uridylate kinase